MPKISAGLLMYRMHGDALEVLLVHPGGPFWRNKDLGAWTIPKGELAWGEDEIAAAQREFQEETGIAAREPYHPLGAIKQKSGKTVHAWAFEGDCDPQAIRSNTFTMEWPPNSGRIQEFPEVDRAQFFSIDQARKHINPAQIEFLDAIERHAIARVDQPVRPTGR